MKFIHIAAIRSNFGDNLVMYQTSMPADQIVRIALGHDPMSSGKWKTLDQNPNLKQLYQDVQRTTSPQRIRQAELYIANCVEQKTKIGVFPPITIAAMSPFEATPLLEDVANCDLVMLKIPITDTHVRMLLDGLGRLSGIRRRYADNEPALTKFPVPLQFIAPSGKPPFEAFTSEHLQEVFVALNGQVTPTPKSELVKRDHTLHAKMVGALSGVLCRYGGLPDNKSVPVRSKAICTRPILLTFVRAALEDGRLWEVTRDFPDNPHLTAETFDEHHKALDNFLTSILPSIWSPDPKVNRESCVSNSAFWTALGLVYHDEPDEAAQTTLAQKVAQLDFRWASPGIMAVQGASGRGSRRMIQGLVEFIRSAPAPLPVKSLTAPGTTPLPVTQPPVTPQAARAK